MHMPSRLGLIAGTAVLLLAPAISAGSDSMPACISHADSPTPYLYDVTCSLTSPGAHGNDTITAGADGPDFYEQHFTQRSQEHKYTLDTALAKFGCNVDKTELGPLIAQHKVDIKDVAFYAGLLGKQQDIYHRTDSGSSGAMSAHSSVSLMTNGIYSNVFIATGDVKALGFCNYWPQVHSTDPTWKCRCAAKKAST